jgi:hypothetical protein
VGGSGRGRRQVWLPVADSRKSRGRGVEPLRGRRRRQKHQMAAIEAMRCFLKRGISPSQYTPGSTRSYSSRLLQL